MGAYAGQNARSNYGVSVGANSGRYLTGMGNVGIGNLAGTGSLGNVVDVDYATSVGTGAQARGDYSVAIGAATLDAATGNMTQVGPYATGVGSIAVGGNAVAGAKARGDNTIALGAESVSEGSSSVAIGHAANTTTANSVALGAGSTADAAVGTASASIGGTTYNFAGTAPAGSVGIGSAGSERTLTNLAAGRLDAASTDGVNGSQLFATNQAVDALAASAGKSEFVSINALPTAQGNVNSDGATGDNSIAIGMNPPIPARLPWVTMPRHRVCSR